MTMDEFFYMQSTELRAAKVIYKRFGIRRTNLVVLTLLSAYLRLKNKQAVSNQIFLDWLDGNLQFKGRMLYLLEELVKIGCVHRMKFRNVPEHREGHSVGVSMFGLRVLMAFYAEVEKVEKKDRDRKKNRSISELAVTSENLPNGYTLVTAGRDN